MKKALLATVMLTACAGDSAIEIVPIPEEPADAAEYATSPTADMPCCDDAPPVLEAPVVTPPPAPTVDVSRLSPVRMAPSFYPECFDDLPRVRRAARARFSRTEPEMFNLRRDRELTDITVLVLSRLCVSEANWIHNERYDGTAAADNNHAELDCPAIYQVLRRTRRSGETLLGAIRWHAHYVTEEREPRGARMRWIVNLQLNNRRPHGFPADLNWERDYRPRWEQMQEFVRSLLRGENLGVCAGAPIITWGGRCDDPEGACDDHLAERRGLVPYEMCGDTANRFWCRPGTAGCPELVVEEPATEEPVVELEASAA